MIYGDYNQPFQIHIDKLASEDIGGWVYGAFNLIIDGKFYPGKEVNWTLNVIVDWMKSFLNENLDDFYMDGCDSENAEFLFKEAIVSRIGYYYDNPEVIIPPNELIVKYPKKVGVEISLYEISDTGFEMFFFRGQDKDFLIFNFQDDFSKVELEKGYFHRVISSLPNM